MSSLKRLHLLIRPFSSQPRSDHQRSHSSTSLTTKKKKGISCGDHERDCPVYARSRESGQKNRRSGNTGGGHDAHQLCHQTKSGFFSSRSKSNQRSNQRSREELTINIASRGKKKGTRKAISQVDLEKETNNHTFSCCCSSFHRTCQNLLPESSRFPPLLHDRCRLRRLEKDTIHLVQWSQIIPPHLSFSSCDDCLKIVMIV